MLIKGNPEKIMVVQAREEEGNTVVDQRDALGCMTGQSNCSEMLSVTCTKLLGCLKLPDFITAWSHGQHSPFWNGERRRRNVFLGCQTPKSGSIGSNPARDLLQKGPDIWCVYRQLQIPSSSFHYKNNKSPREVRLENQSRQKTQDILLFVFLLFLGPEPGRPSSQWLPGYSLRGSPG